MKRTILKAFLEPFVIVVAAVYFVIDALALSILKPLLRKIANLKVFKFIARWIASLGPYSTLALFRGPSRFARTYQAIERLFPCIGTLHIRRAGPYRWRNSENYDCRTDISYWTRQANDD